MKNAWTTRYRIVENAVPIMLRDFDKLSKKVGLKKFFRLKIFLAKHFFGCAMVVKNFWKILFGFGAPGAMNRLF